MANVNHPEHENMKAWAENQKERTFSPDKINHRLKQAIKGYRYTYFVI
jgi:CHAD domain-containing protein